MGCTPHDVGEKTGERCVKIHPHSRPSYTTSTTSVNKQRALKYPERYRPLWLSALSGDGGEGHPRWNKSAVFLFFF